jgi:hypothetical protein
VATTAALSAAEDFEDWLDRKWSKHEELKAAGQVYPTDFIYCAYEDAYLSWLCNHGLEYVGCDLALAMETLVVILSTPERERVPLPVVLPDDEKAWEYLTEAYFRKLVYDWQVSGRAEWQAAKAREEAEWQAAQAREEVEANTQEHHIEGSS